jgi:hypothetical protein
MARLRPDPVEVVIRLRDRIKSKNRTGSGTVLETEAKNRNGNQLEFLSSVFYPVGDSGMWKGLAELKVYSDNDYGYGGAALLGIGTGWRQQFSPRLYFDIDGTLFFGSISTGSGSRSATGFRLTGGLRVILQ